MSSPCRRIQPLLTELALGTLPSQKLRDVESHLHRCALCQKRTGILEDALVEVATQCEPVCPPATLRTNLLAATQGIARPLPFPGFVSRLGQLFQLTEERTRALLQQSAQKSRWTETGPISLLHFQAGDALAGTHAGLVRCAPGSTFPVHRHAGAEISLILAGSLQDCESGQACYPGDVLQMEAGSRHSFQITSRESLLFAVLLYEDWPDFS
jgi:putative transcriptional regulator